MEYKDYYQLLDVAKDAIQQEIKCAYRKLDRISLPPPDWDAGFEFSGGGFTNENASQFSDFFENLFGQQFEQNTQQRSGPGFYSRDGAQGQAQRQDHHAKVFIDRVLNFL
jgi:curved DNA-binding protein